MHNALLPLSILTGAQTKLRFWRYVARDGLFLSAPHLTSALPGTPGCSVCKSGGSGRRRSLELYLQPHRGSFIAAGAGPGHLHPGRSRVCQSSICSCLCRKQTCAFTPSHWRSWSRLHQPRNGQQPQRAPGSSWKPTATSNNCKIKPAMKFSSSLLSGDISMAERHY